MRHSVALLLPCLLLAGAASARAENLPPRPPLDVSGWYLRGNIDDPAQQASEGRTFLQPNVLGDLASGAGRPARYSMREMR